MSDPLKIAIIAAATAIICVSIWIYFSPFQTCLRELRIKDSSGEESYACAEVIFGGRR